MSNMEVHLETKGYAIGSFLEIEGGFDSTSMEEVKHN
jgi:hypothetical protein